MKIQELHDRLFDILCTVDDICKQENIRYFLGFGTAIGALREKDFIPWDDDMDMNVLWEDYPAFKRAMLDNLPEHMHLIEPDAFVPGFYDFIIRIYDDRYLLREEREEDRYYHNHQNHVGTDIFVICKAPQNPVAQKLAILKTKILYGMGQAHRYKIDRSEYSALQKAQTFILNLLGRFFTVEQILSAYETMLKASENRNSTYRFGPSLNMRTISVIKDEWYQTTALGQIRGRDFPVAGGYDAELTHYYGNWRKPPKDYDYYTHHLDEKDRIRPEDVNMDY